MKIKEIRIPEQFGSLYVCPVAEISRYAEHETAHRLLQSAVKDYACQKQIPLTEGDLILNYHEYQKPYFRDYPDLHFNLSHCAGLAVCLFSESECGADVESCRKIRPAVVRKVFSIDEQNLLTNSSEPDRVFTSLWTLKEAYVKAIGRGIGFRMQEVQFRFEEDRVICNQEHAAFHQIQYESYQISLCVLHSGI